MGAGEITFASFSGDSPTAASAGTRTELIKQAALLNSNVMDSKPSVCQLHHPVPATTRSARCADILKQLLDQADLDALPVVDPNDVPCALIERHAYIEYFSRPYSIELFGRKTLAQFQEAVPAFNRKPIVVDARTSLDDVAAIIINAGMQHMVSGFIVTEGERYLGVARGHDLLHHITERKQAELHYLAHYDQLTRIPNRMLMNDRLQMACREADRSGASVGLMFVDLDRFKQFNDTMGHLFGDLLLQAVAARLQATVRGHDTVARLGGDEFAVLLQQLETAADAELTAQRIIDSFNQPFTILERTVFITASLGIVIYPRDERQSANLLAKADAAMYEAKQSGRNMYRAYEPGLTMHSLDHLSLEADLRRAVASEELVLHFQPQVSVATGSITGVEALVRWQHRRRGLLSPGVFMGIAEDSGLIIEIGNWVLREACEQLRLWSLAGVPRLRMAVNISAVQFRRENFTETVARVLRETGVDAACIELGLTENIAMHHADDVLYKLRELKKLGVQLAIDDFGTGFSSLSYLQRFPFDRLKIDQSFVRDMASVPANKSIVQAIVALARSLSLEVVAEGVETAAECAQTRLCNCDEMQGYFHARPMPGTDLPRWLAARRKAA